MAIEITSDTVVKILVRRGLEAERKLTTLTEGELGYSIDTQRVFIGDGITPGGNIIGNRFLGAPAQKGVFDSAAAKGDTVYETSSNTLYAYTGETNPWLDIHPQAFRGYITNNFASLEKSPTGGMWRVSKELVGTNSGIPTGLTLVYDGDGDALYSIQNLKNRIDFDSRFLSLCNNTGFPFLSSSFYFGNIAYKKVGNNLDATVNVDSSLYIDGRNDVPYQIRLLARDPEDLNACAIISDNSDLHIKGFSQNGFDNNTAPYGDVGIFSQGHQGYNLNYNSSVDLLTTVLSSQRNGTYNFPNFKFFGTPRFYDDVYFDVGADVTILGNLSVYGDTTYLETTVTTTSALSVINRNVNDTAMVVGQFTTGISNNNQTIARFEEGENYGGLYPSVLSVKEQQFVGIGIQRKVNFDTYNANLVVSGASLFRPHPGFPHNADGWNGFIVDMRQPTSGIGSGTVYNGNIDFYTAGGGRIAFYSYGGNINFDVGGDTNAVSISGNLRVSDDVVAFALSDVKYKNNIKKIDSALDKLDRISGVEFEWNSSSPYSGKDVGVLAQEVEKVLPEVVTTRSNGAKAVRYEKLVPLIIEAIKELKDRNNGV